MPSTREWPEPSPRPGPTSTVNGITDIGEGKSDPAWVTPYYDDNGNMTTIPQPSDPRDDYTARWDAWNRLVELKDGSTLVAKYVYDGNNRRVMIKDYENDRPHISLAQLTALEFARLCTPASATPQPPSTARGKKKTHAPGGLNLGARSRAVEAPITLGSAFGEHAIMAIRDF